MNPKNILENIKTVQKVDDNVVSSLYQLSKSSLMVVLVLISLITLVLYHEKNIQFEIVSTWAIILSLVVLFRLYDAYTYKYHNHRYTLEQWHKRISILSIMTALLFSMVSAVFFYPISDTIKLYIVLLLIGTSSGSLLSLSSDLRLNIAYPIILVLPIIFYTIFIENFPLSQYILIAAIVYFLFQVTTILKVHQTTKTIQSLQSVNTMFDTVFKNAPIGIFTYNKNLEILYGNKEFGDLLETPIKRLKGENLNETILFENKEIFSNIFSQGSQKYEGPYITASQNNFWIEAKIFPFTDNNDVVIGGVGLIENKTQEHEITKELEYLAKHDSLTGLFNRRGLISFIKSSLEQQVHSNHYSIMFYLDLNRFKEINDSLGHAQGDKILLLVSERILEHSDDACMVGRLNGDEFIVMCTHISDNKEHALLQANHYVKRILKLFEDPFIVNEMHIHVQASIAILVIEPNENDIEEMLRRVDISMYQAKREENYVSYYDSSLDDKQKNLFVLQQNLAYATQTNQLKLFFQPIVQMKNDEIIAAELLIRWAHPTRGMLSPEEFIPLAMKAGLLSNMTWWIIEHACQQVQLWKSKGQWKLKYISINISATQLIEKGFVERFISTLEKYNINKQDILLEITERSLIDNFSNAQSVISSLKMQGVKCAIDDFGTGYSSLSYIKKLSFDTLKIDKTFVQDIIVNPKELILVKTILDLGRQFDYNIIIEGIEDEEQKNLLLTLDHDLNYQGYFYSKPVDIESFTQKFLS